MHYTSKDISSNFSCDRSESRPGLGICDVGGAGSVWIVVILKCKGQVKGDIEVFDLDPLGNVRTLQQEVSC
jgi:hypothetical protein